MGPTYLTSQPMSIAMESFTTPTVKQLIQSQYKFGNAATSNAQERLQQYCTLHKVDNGHWDRITEIYKGALQSKLNTMRRTLDSINLRNGADLALFRQVGKDTMIESAKTILPHRFIKGAHEDSAEQWTVQEMVPIFQSLVKPRQTAYWETQAYKIQQASRELIVEGAAADMQKEFRSFLSSLSLPEDYVFVGSNNAPISLYKWNSVLKSRENILQFAYTDYSGDYTDIKDVSASAFGAFLGTKIGMQTLIGATKSILRGIQSHSGWALPGNLSNGQLRAIARSKEDELNSFLA